MADAKLANIQDNETCYACEGNLKDHFETLENKEKKNLRLR